MIWNFKERQPLLVRDYLDSIKNGPWLLNRVLVWRNEIDEKFEEEISIFRLITLPKNSPNFWYLISQLRTVLYRIHIVPDRQGSAAHEILKIIESPPVLSLQSAHTECTCSIEIPKDKVDLAWSI